MKTFGQFLNHVRSRQNASQLVKKVGISYVYLLDIEKGARPAPSGEVLLALAENLKFEAGERELFFDLAAKEKKNIPVDICTYIQDNYELVEFIRELKNKNISVKYLKKVSKLLEENTDDR